MIYTITLNPALDYYLSFDKFTEGNLNLPKETYKLAGGKGINVSKVLKNFVVESVCLGFVGGFTGEFIKDELKKDGIKTKFIEIDGETRINIKMNNNGVESEIAGTSPKISEENKNSLFNYLKSNLKEEDILILSGSAPASLGDKIYAQIIENLPKGIKVVLDARGEAFKYALEKGVYLIKPNKDEINEFFGTNFNTTDELIEAGKKLQELGAKNVLISLGSKGSIYIDEDKNIYESGVPKGELISSNGAGDSMIAGFIYGVSKNLNLMESYKCGIASGSGTAFSKGLTTLETMIAIKENVLINKK